MSISRRRISQRSLYGIIIFFVTFFIHCNQHIAGGTSTTDNPKIAGVIYDEDSNPASNTRVILLPQDFDPLRDSTEVITDTTDNSGRFTLQLPHSGIFNLQATHLIKNTALFIRNIVVDAEDDSIEIVDDTLKTSGTVTVELPDSVDRNNGYLYIPGTTVFSLLDDTSSLVKLHSVPAATMASVCYGTRSSSESSIIRYDFSVNPGDTTVIAMPQWKHSMSIILNTTDTGADIKEDMMSFPLLVRLTSSSFDFNQTLADGKDIIFTSSNGKIIPYETELWDRANGVGVIWVRTDTIYGNNSTQHIVMYWGNETATNHTGVMAVFDTLDNIAGVWHLGDNCQDASTAGNNGSVYSAGDTSGIIGLCKKFNGNDSIIIPGLLGLPKSVTLSAWAKLDSSAARGGGEIVSIGDAVLTRMDYDNNGLGTGGAVHKSDTSIFNHLGSGRFLKRTGWHLVTFTFNGTTFTSTIFIDGIAAGSRNDPDIPINYSDVGLNTYIGKHANGKKNFGFFGCIDEVRVFRDVKSPDFIKLCYMNQRADDKLMTFKK